LYPQIVGISYWAHLFTDRRVSSKDVSGGERRGEERAHQQKLAIRNQSTGIELLMEHANECSEEE
jgi:hypothetical protein